MRPRCGRPRRCGRRHAKANDQLVPQDTVGDEGDNSPRYWGRQAMSELLSSYWPVAPEMVLVAGALGLLMLGVFRPEGDKDALSIGWLAIAILGAAGWLLLEQPAPAQTMFEGGFVVDAFARFMKILTLAASAASLLLSFDYMRWVSALKFEY